MQFKWISRNNVNTVLLCTNIITMMNWENFCLIFNNPLIFLDSDWRDDRWREERYPPKSRKEASQSVYGADWNSTTWWISSTAWSNFSKLVFVHEMQRNAHSSREGLLRTPPNRCQSDLPVIFFSELNSIRHNRFHFSPPSYFYTFI